MKALTAETVPVSLSVLLPLPLTVTPVIPVALRVGAGLGLAGPPLTASTTVTELALDATTLGS